MVQENLNGKWHYVFGIAYDYLRPSFAAIGKYPLCPRNAWDFFRSDLPRGCLSLWLTGQDGEMTDENYALT